MIPNRDTPLCTLIRPKDTIGQRDFTKNVYVWLGEIPGMPDHCVVAEYGHGLIISGFHSDNFEIIPEDEI